MNTSDVVKSIGMIRLVHMAVSLTRAYSRRHHHVCVSCFKFMLDDPVIHKPVFGSSAFIIYTMTNIFLGSSEIPQSSFFSSLNRGRDASPLDGERGVGRKCNHTRVCRDQGQASWV